jgi:hypothetical protein
MTAPWLEKKEFFPLSPEEVLRVGLAPTSVIVTGEPSEVEVRILVTWDGAEVVVWPEESVVVTNTVIWKVVVGVIWGEVELVCDIEGDEDGDEDEEGEGEGDGVEVVELDAVEVVLVEVDVVDVEEVDVEEVDVEEVDVEEVDVEEVEVEEDVEEEDVLVLELLVEVEDEELLVGLASGEVDWLGEVALDIAVDVTVDESVVGACEVAACEVLEEEVLVTIWEAVSVVDPEAEVLEAGKDSEYIATFEWALTDYW